MSWRTHLAGVCRRSRHTNFDSICVYLAASDERKREKRAPNRWFGGGSPRVSDSRHTRIAFIIELHSVGAWRRSVAQITHFNRLQPSQYFAVSSISFFSVSPIRRSVWQFVHISLTTENLPDLLSCPNPSYIYRIPHLCACVAVNNSDGALSSPLTTVADLYAEEFRNWRRS